MDETNFAPPNDDNLLYFSEQRAIHGIGFIFKHRAYIYRAWKAEAKLGIAMIFNVACIFCTDFSIDSDCFRCWFDRRAKPKLTHFRVSGDSCTRIYQIEKLMANENPAPIQQIITEDWIHAHFLSACCSDAPLLCVRLLTAHTFCQSNADFSDYLYIQRDFCNDEHWFRWKIVRAFWFILWKSFFWLKIINYNYHSQSQILPLLWISLLQFRCWKGLGFLFK